jgi:hypothetical protein
MAYYDIPKGKGFAAVCNDVLRDKKLSLKAKAVFALDHNLCVAKSKGYL